MKASFAVLAALLCATGAVSHAAMVDTPYVEIVSTRTRYSGQKGVAGWGNLTIPSAVQVESGNAFGGGVFYVLTGDGALFTADTTLAISSFKAASLPVSPVPHGSKFVVDASGALAALFTPSVVYGLECGTASGSVKCTARYTVEGVNVGFVNDTTWLELGSKSQALAATSTGLWQLQSETGQLASHVSEGAMFAVAAHAASNLVAAGNGEKIWFLSTDYPAVVVRNEWVTYVAEGAGGIVDDTITSLTFDKDGVLFVGNPTCLNVRATNGSFSRVDGYAGLPYNQIQSLCVDEADPTQLWVGTAMGAALWRRTSNTWRYFYGNRYQPGARVHAIASSGNATLLADDQGLAVLTQELWTLERKAAHYENILTRHDRHGLVSDCVLLDYGDGPSCTNHDSDNNGLWTSLVVNAEAFRWAVTKNESAYERTRHFFNGMKLLNTITGIKGLMARSAVAPGEKHGPGGVWRNSTTMPGWQWKGDTSSDEVTGHMFAYPVVAKIASSSPSDRNEAITLAYDIAKYITSNGFQLIDSTGVRTTWGFWDPTDLNTVRKYSDERGVNSLQMLGFLAVGTNLTGDAMFETAFNELTNATNQYFTNIMNAKIEAPCDDNYSDDELTYLPYYTLFTNNLKPEAKEAVMASLVRTWNAVKQGRSDLWATITLAVTGWDDHEAMEDMMWNLRTWPLELITWPVMNSQRLDIEFDRNADRFGRVHGDSLRVLPANERNQYRWNGNPHDLDGGSGYEEGDPGAWLLPYWMARYHGLIV